MAGSRPNVLLLGNRSARGVSCTGREVRPRRDAERVMRVARVALTVGAIVAMGPYVPGSLIATAQDRATALTWPAASPWKPVTFRDTRPTQYDLDHEAEGVVVRADSNGAASGLVAELPQALEATGISWRWRLEQCLDNGNEHTRSGDDFAARVFILLGRDSPKTPWGWFRRRLFRSPFGSVTPKRAVNYVWASRAEPGDVYRSPTLDDVSMIVVRSACAGSSDWVGERRALQPDFAQGFPESMPPVVAVALMTDTDDTMGHAVAWYADIVLHLRSGESLRLPFDKTIR